MTCIRTQFKKGHFVSSEASRKYAQERNMKFSTMTKEDMNTLCDALVGGK